MSDTEVEISPPRTDSDNEEIHIACMEVMPPKAFCGINLKLHEMVDNGDVTCVVCEDLMRVHQFCPAKDHCDCL